MAAEAVREVCSACLMARPVFSTILSLLLYCVRILTKSGQQWAKLAAAKGALPVRLRHTTHSALML